MYICIYIYTCMYIYIYIYIYAYIYIYMYVSVGVHAYFCITSVTSAITYKHVTITMVVGSSNAP